MQWLLTRKADVLTFCSPLFYRFGDKLGRGRSKSNQAATRQGSKESLDAPARQRMTIFSTATKLCYVKGWWLSWKAFVVVGLSDHCYLMLRKAIRSFTQHWHYTTATTMDLMSSQTRKAIEVKTKEEMQHLVDSYDTWLFDCDGRSNWLLIFGLWAHGLGYMFIYVLAWPAYLLHFLTFIRRQGSSGMTWI